MKSRGRNKVGSKRGNPGYRTPSFFKNQPHIAVETPRSLKIYRKEGLGTK